MIDTVPRATIRRRRIRPTRSRHLPETRRPDARGALHGLQEPRPDRRQSRDAREPLHRLGTDIMGKRDVKLLPSHHIGCPASQRSRTSARPAAAHFTRLEGGQRRRLFEPEEHEDKTSNSAAPIAHNGAPVSAHAEKGGHPGTPGRQHCRRKRTSTSSYTQIADRLATHRTSARPQKPNPDGRLYRRRPEYQFITLSPAHANSHRRARGGHIAPPNGRCWTRTAQVPPGAASPRRARGGHQRPSRDARDPGPSRPRTRTSTSRYPQIADSLATLENDRMARRSPVLNRIYETARTW